MIFDLHGIRKIIVTTKLIYFI